MGKTWRNFIWGRRVREYSRRRRNKCMLMIERVAWT